MLLLSKINYDLLRKKTPKVLGKYIEKELVPPIFDDLSAPLRVKYLVVDVLQIPTSITKYVMAETPKELSQTLIFTWVFSAHSKKR